MEQLVVDSKMEQLAGALGHSILFGLEAADYNILHFGEVEIHSLTWKIRTAAADLAAHLWD